MRVKIGDIEIDFWEQGSPYWFHIKQDSGGQISFTHRHAYLIGQALCSMAKICKANAPDFQKDEFGI